MSKTLATFLREGREALGSYECKMSDAWLADLAAALEAVDEGEQNRRADQPDEGR